MRNQKSRLALEALIFTLLLIWAKTTDFSPFTVGIFILGSMILYLREFSSLGKLFTSFVALLVLSFTTPSMGVVVLVGLIFYLIQGIKTMTFLHRELAYHAGHILILFLAALNFFLGNLSLLVIFIGSAFLMRELFTVLTTLDKTKKALFTLTLALLFTQSAWIASLLPLNIFAASALVLLIAFMFNDFIFHHLENKLSKEVILRNTTIFTVLALIIFGIAQIPGY